MNELNTNTLNTDELLAVTGGTFTANRYDKEYYHAAGVSTCYNFFTKDEFKFMGKSIDYNTANKITELYLESLRGTQLVPQYLKDSYKHALKYAMGLEWDGKPGYNF